MHTAAEPQYVRSEQVDVTGSPVQATPNRLLVPAGRCSLYYDCLSDTYAVIKTKTAEGVSVTDKATYTRQTLMKSPYAKQWIAGSAIGF